MRPREGSLSSPPELASPPDSSSRSEQTAEGADLLPTAQAKLSAFLEHTSDSIFIVDRNLRFITYNTRFARQFYESYGREIEVGAFAIELFPAHTRKQWAELFGRALEGEVLAFQFHEDLGGLRRHYDVRMTPVTAHGNVVGATVISREITARIEMEEALRASEARLSAIFDTTQDSIWSIDPDYRLSAFNRNFAEGVRAFYGAELELGRPIAEFFPASLESGWRQLYERAFAGERFTYEYVEGEGEGATFFEVNFAPIDVDGTIAGVCMQARNITARRRAEEALRHSEQRLHFADRMITVGTLAAGVAHEINNPLAFMFANLEYLERLVRNVSTLDGDTRARLLNAVRVVEDGAGRIRDIVRDLAVLSKPGEETALPLVNVHDVLDLCLTMAQVALKNRATLVKRFGPVPLVRAQPSRLGQVFLNLLMNASQAIPEGAADTNSITVTTGVDGQGRVAVAVTDTGCGIPRELRERIFDPFFTTKPVGMGTGLGLSICHGIVTSLGGEITVESEVGRGSTFRVALPGVEAGTARTGP